jgi:hypothetical protein
MYSFPKNINSKIKKVYKEETKRQIIFIDCDVMINENSSFPDWKELDRQQKIKKISMYISRNNIAKIKPCDLKNYKFKNIVFDKETQTITSISIIKKASPIDDITERIKKL